jgi:hypothetical protein
VRRRVVEGGCRYFVDLGVLLVLLRMCVSLGRGARHRDRAPRLCAGGPGEQGSLRPVAAR